eukprot:GEMP01000732.1.p1 GENE.GEMP01000732.1~~GEMP01000732.1.p1  ORF type:complete len:1119 (+),score=308.21 GEMP01000732.1:57-3413(+)
MNMRFPSTRTTHRRDRVTYVEPAPPPVTPAPPCITPPISHSVDLSRHNNNMTAIDNNNSTQLNNVLPHHQCAPQGANVGGSSYGLHDNSRMGTQVTSYPPYVGAHAAAIAGNNLTQIGKKVRKQQKGHVVATAIDDNGVATADNEVSTFPSVVDGSDEQTGSNVMAPPGLESFAPTSTQSTQTFHVIASPIGKWHNATKAPHANNATTSQHAPTTPQHAASATNITHQQQQQRPQHQKYNNNGKYGSSNEQALRKVNPRAAGNVHVAKNENMSPHVTKKEPRMVWRKALPYIDCGEWETTTAAHNANHYDDAANNRYYHHFHRNSRKSSGTHHHTGKGEFGKHRAHTLHHTRGAKNQPISRESWDTTAYHNRYGDAHYNNSTYPPRSWQNAYATPYGAAGRGRGASKHHSSYYLEPPPPPPSYATIPAEHLGNDDDDAEDGAARSDRDSGGDTPPPLAPPAPPPTPVSAVAPAEPAGEPIIGDSVVSKITSAELLEQQITEANDRLREKLRAARTPGELRQLLHECRSGSNPAVGWFEQQLAERKLAKLEQQPAENGHLLLESGAAVDHLADNNNSVEKEDGTAKTLNSTADGEIVVTPDEEVGAHSSANNENAGSTHGSSEMDNDQLSLSVSDEYKAEDKEEKMLNPEAKEFIPIGSLATATSKVLVTAQYEVSREPSAGEKYYNDLRMRGQKVLERMRLQMQSVWDAAPESPVCAVSATLTPSSIGGTCKLVQSPTTESPTLDDLTTLPVPIPASIQPTPIVIDKQLKKHPLYGIPTPSHPAGTGARLPGSAVKSIVTLSCATNVAAVDYALNLCGLSKFRDILVERGYDRIDFLERALNQELEAVGMKDIEARRLRRCLKSMAGTTLNPQAAEFIPGAGRPPPQMMGQLPGAAPPPAPPPAPLSVSARTPTTLQQHHSSSTANAIILSEVVPASDALRSTPNASILAAVAAHHPSPPSPLTDGVLPQVPVDAGTTNSTMCMTGGRHRRASEVQMEDLPTKFDFLDGRDSEEEEPEGESDDDGWVDNYEAFHDDIPDEDFDFSKSHEFDFRRKPFQRHQTQDLRDEIQWGSFGFAEHDGDDEEITTQSRLKVFAEFSKSSDSSSYHRPLGSSLPPC